MDYTDLVNTLQTAQAQVTTLTGAALASDAANQQMQAALQAARANYQTALAALLTPAPQTPPATTDTTVVPSAKDAAAAPAATDPTPTATANTSTPAT